jgi:hypothetical protein
MPDVVIDPKYQPVFEALFMGTLIATAVWLVLVIFIMLRRRASNLTPIQSAKVNKKVTPDFLSVDHGRQKEMREEGAAFDAELDRRDAEAAREEVAKKKGPDTMLARIARVVSLLMSLFTLATLIGGVIFNVNYLGGMLRNYSAGDRMLAVVERYPFTVSVAALVIAYHVYTYIAGRTWKPA